MPTSVKIYRVLTTLHHLWMREKAFWFWSQILLTKRAPMPHPTLMKPIVEGEGAAGLLCTFIFSVLNKKRYLCIIIKTVVSHMFDNDNSHCDWILTNINKWICEQKKAFWHKVNNTKHYILSFILYCSPFLFLNILVRCIFTLMYLLFSVHLHEICWVF